MRISARCSLCWCSWLDLLSILCQWLGGESPSHSWPLAGYGLLLGVLRMNSRLFTKIISVQEGESTLYSDHRVVIRDAKTTQHHFSHPNRWFHCPRVRHTSSNEFRRLQSSDPVWVHWSRHSRCLGFDLESKPTMPLLIRQAYRIGSKDRNVTTRLGKSAKLLTELATEGLDFSNIFGSELGCKHTQKQPNTEGSRCDNESDAQSHQFDQECFRLLMI